MKQINSRLDQLIFFGGALSADFKWLLVKLNSMFLRIPTNQERCIILSITVRMSFAAR